MDGITNLIDMSLSKLWESVMDREARRAAVAKRTERMNDKSLRNVSFTGKGR